MVDAVKAKIHGDVVVADGRYVARFRNTARRADASSTVRYQRVHAKRDGKWQYLSHRTRTGVRSGLTPSEALMSGC